MVGDLTTPRRWFKALHETSNLISYSATLLLRMQLLEKSISELDNVNCPRGGDKKQCQIPTWDVVGHEIDKHYTTQYLQLHNLLDT